MHLHLLPERYFAVIVIGSMAKLQKAARAQVSRRRAFNIGGAGTRRATFTRRGCAGVDPRCPTPLTHYELTETLFTFISAETIIRLEDASYAVSVLQRYCENLRSFFALANLLMAWRERCARVGDSS